MKRVMITGASGFIGANLTRRLLRDGHEIHLLLRRNRNAWRIADVRKDVRCHEGDLSNGESLDTLVRKIQPDWVFHLAAYGGCSSQNDPQRIVQTNLLGTINLVQACLEVGFEAFINTGSSSEYGFKSHAPSEEERLEPNSNYGVMKASATLFCRRTAQSHRVYLPTLRLYSVYGPYEEPTRLIPTLIVRGLEGQLPPLADPNVARDFVYVDDVTEAYVQAAAVPSHELGGIYNLGTGIQTTLREAVEVARRVLNISSEPKWRSMPNRQWDTNIWVSNNEKIRREFHWQPRYTFDQGFRQTVSWFRGSPEMQEFYAERCRKPPANYLSR